ncbi:MAG: hypothetical protein MZV70_69710 [Desulfobacterales bacterium]|nr:hypothetical protein [Desulfobacterales bacterium]
MGNEENRGAAHRPGVRRTTPRESTVLEIDPEYREGLLSLEAFGRVQVLWWAHGVDGPGLRSTLSCELPYARGTRAGSSPAGPSTGRIR